MQEINWIRSTKNQTTIPTWYIHAPYTNQNIHTLYIYIYKYPSYRKT